MGRDIQPIKISGEDRGNYRDKLQRSLEVFARMLREHLFEADPAQVGLEIELNQVDGHAADVGAQVGEPVQPGLEDQRVEGAPVGDQRGEPVPGHAAFPGTVGARGQPGGAQSQGQVPEGLDIQRRTERLGTGARRGHTEIMTYRPGPARSRCC